jgi:cell wall assembly regulator SMI1
MNDLIARLDKWLRVNRPDYYPDLQPGVTATEISKFEKQFALQVPQLFKELYMWRNGQASIFSTSLQFNRTFMSIELINGSRDVLNRLLDLGEFEQNWWHREWIPFLSNGGGDYLCIDLAGVFTGTEGQIITFWHDWESRNIEYPSLEKWLEVFVGSLEENLWKDVDGDFHPTDDTKWESFLAKHNPGFPIRRVAG